MLRNNMIDYYFIFQKYIIMQLHFKRLFLPNSIILFISEYNLLEKKSLECILTEFLVQYVSHCLSQNLQNANEEVTSQHLE
jgi:hypothetical protein